MTAAAELRAAASKIRERMTDANQARWCEEYAHWAIRHVERNCDTDTIGHDSWHDGEACEGFGRYAGRYIALWNPVVGEVVADWLDAVAVMWDGLIDDAEQWAFLKRENRDSLRSGPWDARHALAIARAINGTEVA